MEKTKDTNSTPSEAGKFIKSSSIYAGGNIMRQLTGFIMLPVYTQYLTPADYGVIGLLTFVISLIDLLFGARLVQAVPKFYHQQDNSIDKKALISTAMIQTAFISTLTLGVLLIFRAEASTQLFDDTDYQLVIALFSVTILTQAIENYGLLYIRIQNRAWFFLALNLSKLILQLSINIYLVVYKEMGVTGVAISTAAVSIFYAILLAWITIRKTGLAYKLDMGNRMLAFSWPLWLAGIAGLYIGSANRFYMKVFGSLEDIGLYELAARFAMVLTVLIWRPINLYWQNERFKYYEEDTAAPAIFNTVFSFCSTILLIAGLGLSLFAEPVIMIMANESYYPAADIVPILVLGTFFGSIIKFSNFSFLATSNTKWIAKNNYFTAIPATIFFLAFIPFFGFTGAAIASTLTSIIQFLIVHSASKRHYDMKLDMRSLFWKICICITAVYLTQYLFIQNDILIDISIRSAMFIVTTAIIIGILFLNKDHRNEAITLFKTAYNSRAK